MAMTKGCQQHPTEYQYECPDCYDFGVTRRKAEAERQDRHDAAQGYDPYNHTGRHVVDMWWFAG